TGLTQGPPADIHGSRYASRRSRRIDQGRPNSAQNSPPASNTINIGGRALRAAACLRDGNRIAASAGLSVSELKAQISVDTAMVSANWRKNCPVIPEMNAHGTNTADSTSATAITGPDTSRIAW